MPTPTVYRPFPNGVYAVLATLRTTTPQQQIYEGSRGVVPDLLIWLDARAL